MHAMECTTFVRRYAELVNINVRENRRVNNKWTNQRNWQCSSHKTKKHCANNIRVGHHYTQQTQIRHEPYLQTTGGKYKEFKGKTNQNVFIVFIS
jgi:hypothetical protein